MRISTSVIAIRMKMLTYPVKLDGTGALHPLGKQGRLYHLQIHLMAGILGIREKSTLSSPVPLFPRIFVIVELQVTQKFHAYLSFARPPHFLLQCHRTSDI